MIRALIVASVVLTIVSAFALYNLKYDARQLELDVQAQERKVEKLEGDIAVLKAEKAYLARPSRLEQLARQQGLAPVDEHQYMRIGSDAAQTGAQTGALAPAEGPNTILGERSARQ